MKKTFKTPMLVFFVLSLFFVVGWIALFVILGLSPADGGAIGGTFLQQLTDKYNAWFELAKFSYGFGPGSVEYWWAAYLMYGAVALCLIGFIVGLVLCIRRKHPRYIPYVIVMIFATYAVVDFSVCCVAGLNTDGTGALKFPYLEVFKNLFTGKPFGEIVSGSTTFAPLWSIYVFAMLCCGLLGFIFVIFTYFFGLAHGNRLFKASKEVASEEAPVTEEVETPKEDEGEAFAMADTAEEVKSEEVPASEEAPVTEEVPSEPAPAYEPMADFMVEPNEVAAQPEEIIVEELPVNNDASKDAGKLDATELASMIRDVVRDIVRDEMSRSKAEKPEDEKPHRGEDNRGAITGASFGGPLVVQYFNGGVQTSPAPVAAPAPAPAPSPVMTKCGRRGLVSSTPIFFASVSVLLALSHNVPA